MTGPGDVAPPDDSGARTYARYQYQALLAVPFCVECGLGGSIRSVTLEHFEDIALELGGRWRLLQVKTREQWLEGWRLRHLIGNGGALKSLVRSYGVLGDGVDASYELLLEGAAFPTDDIAKVVDGSWEGDSDLISRLAAGLDFDDNETCTEFLKRLRILPGQPTRADIVSRNQRLIGERATHLTQHEMSEVLDRLLAAITGAMSVDIVGDAWPDVLLNPDGHGNPIKERIQAKTLTRERLAPMVASLGAAPRILLSRTVEVETEPATTLEDKLIAGGAAESTINDAKYLRALATIEEAKALSAGLVDPEERLEDVRQRLGIVARAIVARFVDSARPAVEAWSAFLGELPPQTDYLDPSGLFHRDSMLLLGEVCQLADLCLVDWGMVRA